MTPEQMRCADIVADPLRDAEQADAGDELAESVRHHGVLRPVLVRAVRNGYVIVHGERRWRAACKAGLDAIPAWIVQGFLSKRQAARTTKGRQIAALSISAAQALPSPSPARPRRTPR